MLIRRKVFQNQIFDIFIESELSILEIGSSYPIGLYNVLLSQGEKVKSVRIVKR